MSTPLRLEGDAPDLLAGVVEAGGVTVAPAPPALAAEIDALLARRAAGEAVPEAVRAAVRDLLRRGGFKPTGRSKPASEFLAQAASRGEFPRISNVVDVCNLLSLASGLPISLLDRARALGGAPGLVVRLGRPGEGHVFNAAGHAIDVEGLLCVAREDGPALANPVKDSMESKIQDDTRDVVAVVWGGRGATDETSLAALLARFEALFRRDCGAGATSSRLLR
jgi:DNA/RNA-binding domain of Phe-tRNA-synthetase-like protein